MILVNFVSQHRVSTRLYAEMKQHGSIQTMMSPVASLHWNFTNFQFMHQEFWQKTHYIWMHPLLQLLLHQKITDPRSLTQMNVTACWPTSSMGFNACQPYGIHPVRWWWWCCCVAGAFMAFRATILCIKFHENEIIQRNAMHWKHFPWTKKLDLEVEQSHIQEYGWQIVLCWYIWVWPKAFHSSGAV